MIRDYQALARTWFPKGRQKIVPTYGKHRGVKLIGILDYESGETFCIERERYDAKVFLAFLKMVVEKYPGQKIVMVLDNAKIHHAKLIQPFLQDHPELQLMFLPPYSPQLNLIEGLWGWLKKAVIYNVFYSTVDEIRNAVQGFMTSIQKDLETVKKRLCSKL